MPRQTRTERRRERRQARQSETTRRRLKKRLIAVPGFLVLSWFAYGWFAGTYHRHLIIHDRGETTATLADKSWDGHGKYDYQYEVAGVIYGGSCRRDYDHPKYGKAEEGAVVPVYYSKTHPKVSMLFVPGYSVVGLPWILLVSLFWMFFLVTLVEPDSGWAMDLTPKERESP